MTGLKRNTSRNLRHFTASALAIATAILIGVVGTTASEAWAETVVGFQINSVEDSPLFTFSNQGTESNNDDTLTAGPTQVDLSVAIDSIETVFPNATFEMDADLVGLDVGSLNGTTVYELSFDGSFSFKAEGSGDSIFDVSFLGARLLTLEFSDSGMVDFSSGIGAQDDVTYTLGLEFPSGLLVKGEEEFGFTLTGLQALAGGPVHITMPDGVQFEDFTFNSSFSGSLALIPEPSTMALVTMGMLCLAGYRRNQRLA